MPKVPSPADASRVERPQQPFRTTARMLAVVLCASFALGGCAPDAFRPDAPYEDFLNRVESKCQYQRIGRVQIDSEFLQDPYFLDLTSRFYNGELQRAAYVESLLGAYDAKPDSPGVRCLLGQTLQPAAPPAFPPPPAMAAPR
ncbi:hypothetical protein [Accumulibacter sp.]|uniref:hypothetical protein n=1 Tax=Accumulibacter sp. TaxID=2053492 RepID=UPI0028C408F5|nr:hypothetical protein [Accumulibacter sp.]